MAKHKSGLPPNFDLEVSESELVGKPARLPGYLERSVAPSFFAQPEIREEKIVPINQTVEIPTRAEVRQVEHLAPVMHKQVAPLERPVVESEPAERLQPSRSGKRAQINLPPDIKTKLVEMAHQFSAQSNNQEITRSDIVVGLILALYEAKDLVNVGTLPVRGKWGTSTAKSIGPALTLAFQEALQDLGKKEGGNPFEKFKQAASG